MTAVSWLQKHPNEIVLTVLWLITGILIYNYYTLGLAGLYKLLLMMISISIGGVTVIFSIGYFALRAGYTKEKADAELEKFEDELITGKRI